MHVSWSRFPYSTGYVCSDISSNLVDLPSLKTGYTSSTLISPSLSVYSTLIMLFTETIPETKIHDGKGGS